jgi:RNA polymerase sigma-70 factor (ECF subfamily)
LPILQELSPAYRTIFNLYVMEEMSHREIADLLGISEATSRSNLTRAKEQLRVLWIKNAACP